MTPWNRHPRRFRRLFPFALLCALTVALVGFGGSPQAPVPPPEPQSVGPVANLVASAEGQGVGTVRLTWTAAENAQVHFIVYLKSSDWVAGGLSVARMEPFSGTEGVLRGLEPGTSYDFIAIGMRWNWIKYGTIWGRWSEWASATPPSGSAATDRAALIAFYNATDGPNWANDGNWIWLSDAPIRVWPGITTDGNGRVIRLDLFGENRLTGVIPPELGSLTNLRYLRLFGNQQLTGAIPPELGRLTNLEGMSLHSNRLTGAIPPELGDLTNLESLHLTLNQLTGAIPPELGRLTNLESLYLGGNRLTGAIPPELGSLTNLESLQLSGNQLTGAIPPELGDLANLERLYLGGNRLTGAIPPELGSLPNLKSLYLRGNQLTGCIPSDWRYVISNDLADLEIPFCDPAPTTLPSTDRATLVAFYNAMGGPGWQTSYNWLSDAPLGFWYGVKVDRNGRVIKLGEWGSIWNHMTGVIPPELGSLTSLEYLDLYGNQMTGAIPSELGDLTNLEYLNLRGSLTGPIPPELGNLTNLEELHLYDNQLTGAIPPELGGLANLTVLYLAYNQLTGVIPPELGRLTNLEELHLYDNRLTGAIPPELGRLANLEELDLSDNQLTGAIPPELGSLANLEELDLSDNQLTGAIPPELGNLTNLTGLRLSGNRFTGCIPAVWRDADIDRLSLPNLPFCNPGVS